MRKTITPEARHDLFVGATELAMLDLLRQQYVENEDIKPLFVVDFPRLAESHCVPPQHLSMPEVTGLLPSPEKPEIRSARPSGLSPQQDIKLIKKLAGDFPETLGLSEVLSRFIFDRSWSNGIPKLMLSTQAAEAGSIEDALQKHSLEEWRRSATRKQIQNALDQFSEAYRSPGKSVDEFVQGVADKAEELLPAIYGEYSQVRRFLRFEDIKPLADEDIANRPVIFAQNIAEIRARLAEVVEGTPEFDRFRTIQKHWEDSIPETSRKTMSGETSERMRIRRCADAQTLATIEYLNDRFNDLEEPYRLVFVSDDTKLFDGALKRFGVIPSERALRYNPEQSTGSASAFHKGRYAAHLLLSSPSSLRKAPILDPRVLMTGRRFVEFSSGSKEEGADPVRAITEWLPVFFGGRERDAISLSNTYLHIQQGHRTSDGQLMNAEMFTEAQYKALELHWHKYVRTVGTAHGLIRYSTRAHLRDLLLALVQDDRSAMEKAIHRRLDNVMGDWLPAVGGATLLSPTSKTEWGASRIRSVPPLLLPAWPTIQRSLIDSLRGSDSTTTADLKWIDSPTAKNLGLDNEWKSTPEWKRNYVRSVRLAYGFASIGNWTASYRLASSAYSLAEIHRDSSGRPDDRYISGREAAFLASVSARRSLASRPVYLQASNIEQNLINRLLFAINLEAPLFDDNGWQLRKDAHELRAQGEVLSWRVYRHMCAIMRRALRGENLTLFPEEFDAEGETWDVNQRVLSLKEKFRNTPTCEAGKNYIFTLNYLGRQLMFNLLQIDVFDTLSRDMPVDKAKARHLEKVLRELTKFGPQCSEDDNVQLPWSCFENHVLTKALACVDKSVSGRLAKELYTDDRVASDGDGQETTRPMEHSLSLWRLEILTRQ